MEQILLWTFILLVASNILYIPVMMGSQIRHFCRRQTTSETAFLLSTPTELPSFPPPSSLFQLQPLRFALVSFRGPNATWQSENCEKSSCSHRLPSLTSDAFTPSSSFFQNKEGVRFSASHILCISLVNKSKCDNCSSMDEEGSWEAQWIETWLRKTQAAPCQNTEAESLFCRLFSSGTTKFPSSALWGSKGFICKGLGTEISHFPHHFVFSPPWRTNFPHDRWLGKWKERSWESPGKGMILVTLLCNSYFCSFTILPGLRGWWSWDTARKHITALVYYGNLIHDPLGSSARQGRYSNWKYCGWFTNTT